MAKKPVLSPLWHRIFCLLMAFYVINISIDAPDGYVTANSKGEYREDLSVNEIESFFELVLEECFNLHDAIPEHDEPDEEEDQLTKIFMDWSISGQAVSYLFYQAVSFLTTTVIPYTGQNYRFNLAEISTPPPQIA